MDTGDFHNLEMVIILLWTLGACSDDFFFFKEESWEKRAEIFQISPYCISIKKGIWVEVGFTN